MRQVEGELNQSKTTTVIIFESYSTAVTCITAYTTHSSLTFEYNISFQYCIFLCLLHGQSSCSKSITKHEITNLRLLTWVLSLSTLQVKCQWPPKMNTHTNGNHRECCLQVWILNLWRTSLCSSSEDVCVVCDRGTNGNRQTPPGAYLFDKWTPRYLRELRCASLTECYNTPQRRSVVTLWDNVNNDFTYIALVKNNKVLWKT